MSKEHQAAHDKIEVHGNPCHRFKESRLTKHNSELRRKEVKFTDVLSLRCRLLTNELEYRVKKVKEISWQRSPSENADT